MNEAAIAIVAGLFAAQFAQGQGTLYVSNLDRLFGGSAPVASDSSFANSFYTGSNPNGYTLDSVELLMGQTSGSPSGFAVSLYGGGAFPGTNMSSLSGLDPTQSGGLFTYTAPSGILLSPETTYFIAVTGGTPVTQGSYSWSYATDNSYNSSDSWILNAYRYSSTDGSRWVRGSHPFQFAVYATAIPEPSSALLALFGAVMFGIPLLRQGNFKSRCKS